ncbi:corticotropin-releasing factor receptor 1-like isoform X1, partial [Lates japonicus]
MLKQVTGSPDSAVCVYCRSCLTKLLPLSDAITHKFTPNGPKTERLLLSAPSNFSCSVTTVVCVCVLLTGQVSPAELTCETLILLSTNLTARTLALLNQTFTISNSSGSYCDLSVDGIGTCWPRSAAGEVISRPCPEQFNGIHYNTTN